MANTLLESSAISAFCSSLATMLGAGIQTDEAVHMLVENRGTSNFTRACNSVYKELISGSKLSRAMEVSGAFPAFASEMVRAGETSGRVEEVLRRLAHYYETEGRSFAKLQSSIGYPAALLCVMTIILLFTVAVIIPVFGSAYENISGSLTTGAFSMVGISTIIGWVALVIMLIATVAALMLAIRSRSEHGRLKTIKWLRKFGPTKQAMYQFALSQFTGALSSFLASGEQEESALRQATNTVDHPVLKKKLEASYADITNMKDPKSLAQAFLDNEVMEPIYGQILLASNRTGSIDQTLMQLSQVFFDDSNSQIDACIDSVEPIFAAFLTVAVGATLIAVMLPLIGIMGSIA